MARYYHYSIKQSLVPLILALGALGCAPGKSADSAPADTGQLAIADITAPSGHYRHDPAHATLQFSILHAGLSNYVAGFTDYSIDLQVDTDNPSTSSVAVTINPKSIRTDFKGDYHAGHPKSKFQSWEEDLALSDKFFNADLHPEISFQSTSVAQEVNGNLQIVGDLTMLGQTHPVTLDGHVVGATNQHPFTNQGALGLSLSGSFQRSTFGMDYLINPPLVGNTVTVSFEGEMHLTP